MDMNSPAWQQREAGSPVNEHRKELLQRIANSAYAAPAACLQLHLASPKPHLALLVAQCEHSSERCRQRQPC